VRPLQTTSERSPLHFERARSRPAREAAEQALVRLALKLGAHRTDLVVIGGLTPDLLTSETPIEHQGTTDVDVLIQVGLVYERDELDFSWLEHALGQANFEPIGAEGWRWWVDIDGTPVKLEILCDTMDNPGQQIALPGCDRLTAMNLSGPRPALTSYIVRELRVADASPETPDVVAIRFADLGGYLLAKAAAAFQRDEPRDLYDFAFVLLYNEAGGPAAAADAIRKTYSRDPHGPSLGLLRAIARKFASPDNEAARTFAREMAHADPDADIEVLTQDAIGAAIILLDALAPITEP
jgi:hypothetical protein